MSAARGAVWGAACGLALGAAALLPLVLAREVPARLDLVDFFWPMKAYTAARWAAGGVPLWNPLSGCGEPWLAQLQSGVLYPPDLLFLLPWPAAAWLAILFHAVLGAAGMAAWLKDLGASRGAAVAGAGLFVGSGAFVSLFPVLNNAWTAAWLPWVFLAAHRAATGGSGAGLALAAALAFLGGEPALAAAGTAAAVLVALATRVEDRPRRGTPLRAAAAGLLLAGGIACAAAWPFADLLARSGRLARGASSEALARPLGPGDLGDLVAPPRDSATHAASPARGGYLVTLAATPLVFLLAAGAGRGFPGRRRLLAALALLGAAGLLAALGARGGLLPLLLHAGALPGLRFPARWFVFTHLALAAAAAAGWDGWLWGTESGEGDESRRERRASRLAAGVALVALALCGSAALATAGTRDAALTGLVALATLAGGALLFRARGGAGTPVHRAALLVALLAPLPVLTRPALEGAPADRLRAAPAVAAGIGTGRIFSVGSDPSLLSAFSQPAGGWDETTPLRARALLAGYANLDLGLPSATSASPLGDRAMKNVLGAALLGGDPARLLALADVRTLITPFPTRVPGARLEHEAAGVRRYALPPGAGRFFFPRAARLAKDAAVLEELRRPRFAYEETAFVAASALPLPPPRAPRGFSVGRVLEDAPERTVLATSSSDPGLVVFTRSFDPGWRAEVDGVRAVPLRVDLAFLGVALPAGEHRVTLTYAPRSWRWGRVVSAVSLLLAAVLWSASPRREAP